MVSDLKEMGQKRKEEWSQMTLEGRERQAEKERRKRASKRTAPNKEQKAKRQNLLWRQTRAARVLLSARADIMRARAGRREENSCKRRSVSQFIWRGSMASSQYQKVQNKINVSSSGTNRRRIIGKGPRAATSRHPWRRSPRACLCGDISNLLAARAHAHTHTRVRHALHLCTHLHLLHNNNISLHGTRLASSALFQKILKPPTYGISVALSTTLRGFRNAAASASATMAWKDHSAAAAATGGNSTPATCSQFSVSSMSPSPLSVPHLTSPFEFQKQKIKQVVA